MSIALLTTRVTTGNQGNTGNFNVTAPSDGLLVAVLCGSVVTSNQVENNITRNGVSMTLAIRSGVVSIPTSIRYSEVSAGIHTIQGSFSGTMRNSICRVYLLTDYASPVPIATDRQNVSATSTTLNLSENSMSVFGLCLRNIATNTWSEGQEYDNTLESTDVYSFGSAIVASSPIIGTLSGNANIGSIGASWQMTQAGKVVPIDFDGGYSRMLGGYRG